MRSTVPKDNDREFALGLLEDIQQRFQKIMPKVEGASEFLSDPWQTLGVERGAVIPYIELHAGIVQYSVPTFGFHRVAVDVAGSVVQCRSPISGAGGPGAREVSVPSHGDLVYVAIDKINNIGTILGVIPRVNERLDDSYCDLVVQGSGVGLYASPQYRDYVAALADGGGVMTFSGDRPLDGLPGDYTIMSPTGMGLHLDDELAYLRSSEICGLFLFREDGHTRLSGESLAIESLCQRIESGIEGGECIGEAGQSIYPWEAAGQVESAPVETVDIGKESITGGSLATVEPLRPDAISINRLEEFGGYLGQGSLLVLSTPTGDGYHSHETPVDRRGLFRQQVMMDGSYLLESARQIFIAKSIDIPVLTRKRPANAPLGEDAYAPNGQAGGNDALEHKVKQLEWDDLDASAMAPEESYAYASAWQGLNAAVYHPDVDVTYANNQTVSSSFVLDQNDQLEVPDPEQVRIDHRYGDVDLYRVMSLFAFLPTGEIVLEDGYGASIKLNRGRVEISGTSVSVNAAKTFNTFAGKIALNAQKFLDVSSGTGDVRIMAQRNLMMLGGNSGIGGVLVENRGSGFQSDWSEEPGDAVAAGIVIKSVRSFVSVNGGDVIIKSGPTTDEAIQGTILIDAGAGQLTQRAIVHNRYSQSTFNEHFGTSPDAIRSSVLLSETYSKFPGSLGINGQLIVNGGVTALQGYTTLLGHYASVITNQFNGMVGRERYPDKIQSRLDQLTSGLRDIRDYGNESIASVRDRLENDDLPANPVTIQRTSFGFPSSNAYGAEAVSLHQPKWQRLAGSQAIQWREPEVLYQQSKPTLSWPGKSSWDREDGFKMLEIGSGDTEPYFNQSLAAASDPTVNRQAYEKATTPSSTSTSLLGGLRTIN